MPLSFPELTMCMSCLGFNKIKPAPSDVFYCTEKRIFYSDPMDRIKFDEWTNRLCFRSLREKGYAESCSFILLQ